MRELTNATDLAVKDQKFLELIQNSPPDAMVQKTEANVFPRESDGEPSEGVPETPVDTVEEGLLPDKAMAVGESDKLISRMNKAMVHGNVSKVINILSNSGLKDLSDPKIQKVLLSKYPRAPGLDMEWENDMMPDQEEILFDKLDVIAYMVGKKYGAAQSMFGFSTDHWRWILEYGGDEAGDLLLEAVQIIANGDLKFGEARNALLASKGIPCAKSKDPKKIDVRPVANEDPLIKTVSYMMNKEAEDDIVRIIGCKQLGGPIQGGGEILIHTVRGELQKDKKKVCCSGDVKNAFNSMLRDYILKTILEKIPRLYAYVKFLLGESSQVVYNDSKTGVCLPIEMVRGLIQGDPLSGSIFNVCQADAIKKTEEDHPDVNIYSQHDGHFIVGYPEDVLEAFKTLSSELGAIGLNMQNDKSEIFGYGDLSTDFIAEATAMEIEIVDKELGIKVGGSPIGSDEYEAKFCEDRTDEILASLRMLEDLMVSPTGFTKAKIQSCYSLARLCFPQRLNHLLRTVPPSNTRLAANKLDKGLVQFIFEVTNSEKYLPARNSSDMMDVIKRLHLKVSAGGCGIISSVNNREGAFVGSLALCANHMGIICPDLICTDASELNTIPMFQEYSSIVEDLKGVKGLIVYDIELSTIWDAKVTRVQNRINIALGNRVKNQLYNELPQGDTRYGLNGLDSLSITNKAIRLQGIANTDKTVSAFLYANPAIRHLQMENEAFTYALWTRLLLNLMGSRKYCVCGKPMDSLANHSLVCSATTIRNKLRNWAHAMLLKAIRGAFGDCINGSGLKLMDGEPRVSEFFDVRQDAQVSSPVGVRNPHNSQRRADIGIIDTLGVLPPRLYDATIVCPVADYVKSYNSAGDAAKKAQERKTAQYMKNFHIENILSGDCHMFAVESNACIALSTRETCEIYAKISKDPDEIAIQKIYQRISVAMHKIRAQQIKDTLYLFSLDEVPLFPYTNGPISSVPPPIFLGSGRLRDVD